MAFDGFLDASVADSELYFFFATGFKIVFALFNRFALTGFYEKQCIIF